MDYKLTQQNAPRGSVMVLGMHRSGTSLTAHFIHSMGFHVSPNQLRTDSFNAKGYWEDRDVVETNALLLRTLGGSWRQPVLAAAEQDWIIRQNLRLLQFKIGGIMRKYPSEGGWVIKDPRLSLTLPYWLPFMQDPRFVMCVRNPVAVAQSLVRRNGMPLAEGLRLWHQYTWQPPKHTRGYPTAIVHYEQYFQDRSRHNAKKLANFLGLTDPDLPATSPVEHRLRHNVPENSTVSEAEVGDTIQRFYAALRDGSMSVDKMAERFPAGASLPAPSMSIGDEIEFVLDWTRRAARLHWRRVYRKR